jgi:hypothetical protein
MQIKNYFQKKFINWLIRDLFNFVSEEDILRIDEFGNVFYKNRKLDSDMVSSLKESAEGFSDSTMWKIVSSELRYQANRRMLEKSQSVDDILVGKAALWVLQIMEDKIDDLSKLK